MINNFFMILFIHPLQWTNICSVDLTDDRFYFWNIKNLSDSDNKILLLLKMEI